MRIEKRGNDYTCLASANGTSWQQIGQKRTVALTDVKVGFGAAISGETSTTAAAFDYFATESLQTTSKDWQLYR
jgi:hypothetical protein